jgi:threonine dehydratase
MREGSNVQGTVEDLKSHPVSVAEVFRARPVVNRFLKPTQMIRYEGLSRVIGAEVYVKHENHNPTGSFKIRGGINLIHHLRQRDVRGVTTFSTGNHGLSIATAAQWHGLAAVVVVPEDNNPAKNRAIRETGAELIEAGRTFEEAAEVVEQLCEERGLYYAHPADEPHLINGVGTEFLEVMEDLPDVDVMIVPLGAGSEAAAAITVLKGFRPEIEVIAVQAEKSPAAYRSWKKGRICSAPNETFAGGFATGKGYALPFSIYRGGLHDFLLLSEEDITEAMALAMYYTHHLTEGAGAAALMAALRLGEQLKGKKVVVQMSGCNASTGEVEKAISCPTFREGIRPVTF